MAKRKGGGSSAARSAAAKKGWETRRRGGGASKPTSELRPQMLRAAKRAGANLLKAQAAYRSGDRSQKRDVSSATAGRALEYLYAKANKGRLPNGQMATTARPKGLTSRRARKR